MKIIFLSDWQKNPYKDLLSAGLRAYGAEVSEYEWSTLFLPRLLRVGKPTVLHLQTLHPFLRAKTPITRAIKLLIFVSQICTLRLLGVKTVWTVHEWADKISDGADNIPVYSRRLIGWCLNAFVVHCKSTGSQIAADFYLKGTEKVHVVPHGNYIGHYANQTDLARARKELGLSEESVTFLLFGDLYRYKGALEAVDAFKGLNQSTASLIVAGKPRQENLQEEIEVKIEGQGNIIFTPARIPDDAVQTYMNAADCVLVPYNVFTTSGVAILAMSFGRVCIAPNIGFFSDVLDASGSFLYDSAAENGLADAMRRAVEKRSQLAQMGDRNLSLAYEWNWHHIAKLTIEAYNLNPSETFANSRAAISSK